MKYLIKHLQDLDKIFQSFQNTDNNPMLGGGIMAIIRRESHDRIKHIIPELEKLDKLEDKPELTMYYDDVLHCYLPKQFQQNS